MYETTIQARNFRVIKQLTWSPSGVCLLSGPNGSGKSTALESFRFLRALFEQGVEAAFNAVDGRYFRRFRTPEDEPVIFELVVGDIRWNLRFPMSSTGLKGTFGEELYRGGELVLRAAMFDEGFYLGKERRSIEILEQRCCAKWLWDRGEDAWMKPLVEVLTRIRVYKSYWLNQVKEKGDQPVEQRSVYLAGSGNNLWSVLANWKNSPTRYRGQFEWVMSSMRDAFPGLVSRVEFDRGLPVLYPPREVESEVTPESEEGLPPRRAADGWLTGLLHLTAVAGANPGSILAFDEMENQLHPYAIRSIIGAMRRQAEERDLTILLTTHSPVVMNAFRNSPEQVYVLELPARDRTVPVAMTELHSEEWLAQAKLGTLYEHLAFGAPPVEEKKQP